MDADAGAESAEPPSRNVVAKEPRKYHYAAHRRRAICTSSWEGFFSVCHITLTGPMFLTGYLLMIGASDWHLGLVAAMPHFLHIIQLIAAYIASHMGSRKLLCILGILGYRGVHIALAALPFIPGLSSNERVWMVLGVLLVSNLSFMLVGNTWWFWMADLLPMAVRGRYFGFRAGVGLMTSTVWSLGGGALLDYMRARGHEQAAFAVLFCVATFFAMTGLWLLTRQYEPPMKRDPQPAIREVLAILGHPEFRRGAIFFFIWNFGIGLSLPFVAKHMQHHMHMSYMMMLLYPVMVNVIGMFVARKWGRFVDHFGIRNTMLICASIASFAPFAWIFTAPGVTWPVWLDAILTGTLMTGMNIAASNLPLLVTPERNKLHYLAVFSTIAGLGLGIACVLSGKIAMMLDGVTLSLPGVPNPVISYHIIFVFSAALRLTSLLFLLRLCDSRSHDFGTAVTALLRNLGRPFRPVSRLLTAK